MLGLEEFAERIPVVERVADRLAHGCLRAVATVVSLQPFVKTLHDGPGPRLAHRQMLRLPGQAVGLGIMLDIIEFGDQVESLLGFVVPSLECIEEFATSVCHAAGSSPAFRTAYRIVAGIRIDHELSTTPDCPSVLPLQTSFKAT